MLSVAGHYIRSAFSLTFCCVKRYLYRKPTYIHTYTSTTYRELCMHIYIAYTRAHIHNITAPTPHQTTEQLTFHNTTSVSVSVTGMSVLHKTNRTCGWLLNDNVHFGNNKQRVNRSPVLVFICSFVHIHLYMRAYVSVSLKQKFDTILKNYWCPITYTIGEL